MWPGQRSANGGIDQIPLVESRGELWLAGKHAVGPDPESALAQVGATTIVCLTQIHELTDRYPNYIDWLSMNAPERAVLFPIPDLSAPTWELAHILIEQLLERLANAEKLLIHCAAGFGRTGTIAACVLIRRGVPAEEALQLIAACRPMAGPGVGAQRDLVAKAVEHHARTV